MAGNLEAAVNDSAKVIRVSALTPPLSGALLRIEDELLAFRSVKRLDTPPFRPNEDGDWNVDRGVAGTTAASHAEDSEVVYAYPVYGDEPIDQTGGEGLPGDLEWSGTSLRGTTVGGQPVAIQGAAQTDDHGAFGANVQAQPGATGAGGELDLYGGDASDAVDVHQSGGDIKATAGFGDQFNANPAIAVIQGGRGDGTGGGISLTTGAAETDSDQDGGDITITFGAGDGAGRNALLILVNYPTADPEVAGAVYTDGVPSGGVPKALMVSGGAAP